MSTGWTSFTKIYQEFLAWLHTQTHTVLTNNIILYNIAVWAQDHKIIWPNSSTQTTESYVTKAWFRVPCHCLIREESELNYSSQCCTESAININKINCNLWIVQQDIMSSASNQPGGLSALQSDGWMDVRVLRHDKLCSHYYCNYSSVLSDYILNTTKLNSQIHILQDPVFPTCDNSTINTLDISFTADSLS